MKSEPTHDEKSIKRLALIPARSGSKGVVDKNIRLLNGKPLMAYSIEVAMKSGEFDRVMVSTDSERYANVARKLGADVPFLRSYDNANDSASTWDVIKEVIGKFDERGEIYDEIMVLQPTSPLRTVEDILGSIRILEKNDGDCLQSVTETEYPPQWCGEVPADLRIDNFIKPEYDVPRQMMPIYYRINGAIYLLHRRELCKKHLFMSNCYAYIMPRDRSIDIDTILDFTITEAILNKSKQLHDQGSTRNSR